MIGYLYIAFYCVFNALSFVFISILGNAHGQAQSIIYIFSLGILLFNLFCFKNLQLLYLKVGKKFRAVLGLNITTAISWLASFYALRFIDPANMLCIGMAVIPITTFFIVTPIKEYKANIATLLSILFVIFSMLLIIHENVQELTVPMMGSNIFWGILISVVGGIFGAAIGTYSEVLSKAKFQVKEILAVRFYLLVLTSILISIYNKTFEFNWQTLQLFSVSAVIIVFLPLIIYQKAIQHLGSLTVSILISFTPILAYFMQLTLHKYRFSAGGFGAILFCCFTIGLLNYARYKVKTSSKSEISMVKLEKESTI